MQLAKTKIVRDFNKTAGVYEPPLARQFVCRLNEFEIAHLATPFDGNTICILVRDVDLERAIELQPQKPLTGTVRKSEFSLPSRLLILLPMCLFIAAILSLCIPLDRTIMTILGTIYLLLMTEGVRAAFKLRRARNRKNLQLQENVE